MMAADLPCDLCSAEPASLMQSNLANGDSIAVGDGCLPQFLLTMLAELTDVDVTTDENPVTGDIEPIAAKVKPRARKKPVTADAMPGEVPPFPAGDESGVTAQ